ncbi:hypothetical protein GWK14_02910 [Staphylococcus haemolyticus]|uniref:hypothetical protein n=1 Tax=Staphylococcus haemolyticus TaxID=1283 RepID=UPI001E3BA184|nr:hypothetical protein [Staphylococcus haemolyticus]MCE2378152.1 hypothetical protein [Staphylococcus haemolyticus]
MAIRKKAEKKLTCMCCNRNLTLDLNYYPLNDNNPAFPNGYYPICKDCCADMLKDEENGYKSFIQLLRVLDYPFRYEAFEQVNFDYVRYMNKASIRRNASFIDSDALVSSKSETLTEENIMKLTPDELRQCKLYWGEGDYTEDDYIYLISRYESYCKTYDVDSPTFENIITQICQLELEIRKKRTKGSQSTKEETNLILNLMKSAGISPNQEKESKTNAKETFGVWVKRWENDKPVPEPLEEFKDVDGIEKYVQNNFLSPMRRSLDLDDNFHDQYQEHIDKYGISTEELLGVEDE